MGQWLLLLTVKFLSTVLLRLKVTFLALLRLTVILFPLRPSESLIINHHCFTLQQHT